MKPQSISRVLHGAAAPDRQPRVSADLFSDTATGGSADLHPHVAAWPWRFEVYHPGLREVLPAVQAFCSAVIRREPPRRWLSLLGPSGVGKTHVLKQAMACLQSAAARGHWKIPTPTGHRGPQIAHLIPAVDLEDFRAARDYAKYDLIYIEDIGSGAALDKGSGAVTRNRIAELLQLRSGKWTLLDANLYRREIEQQIDGRIASRLKRDGSWMVEVPQEVPDFWDR
jgi:chromosomal replication initiation ATPase DnaA